VYTQVLGTKDKKSESVETVKQRTLSEILQKNSIQKVAYCSIDVEGMEHKVIDGIDFEKYDIRSFTIENNESTFGSENIRKTLEGKGYEFASRIGHLDDLFVKKSLINKL